MSEEDLRAEIERLTAERDQWERRALRDRDVHRTRPDQAPDRKVIRLVAEDWVLRLLDDVARAESERDAARESLRIDRETSHVAIATLRNDAALGRAVRNSGVTLDWLTERGRELRNSRGSLSLSSGAYAAAHAQEIVGNEESEEVCDG